ncbi:MAG: LuxR C-terminal-related transcriptional regulator [Spirochaetia bacterium]
MPRLPRDWVERPRLSRALIDALQNTLVLISAPAGYGKSTLLAETLRGRERSVGWVSLDSADNNLTDFWTCLAAALRVIAPTKCTTLLEVLASPDPPPNAWVRAALLDAIGNRGDGFILVLDDYHLIESRSVHEAVAFLVEHVPSDVHLVISGRADPPMPLSRWRANGMLAELRAGELEFTRQEAEAFFRSGTGIPLSDVDLAILESRTEGWIVGLKMAALSLKGKADISGAIAAFSGSNRYILDYLVEEALDRQPSEIHSFLLETSVLKRLCGPLCDTVTGRSDGASMLARLESVNLFIIPLDDERNWYRYHHLFASLLRNALSREGREAVKRLHLRAGSWYETSDSPGEAVDHFLEGGGFPQAIDVLERVAQLMLGQSQAAGLLGYHARIPPESLRKSPWLCLCFAWAALQNNTQDVLTSMLSMIGEALSLSPDVLSAGSRKNLHRIKGHVLCIRSFIAQAADDLPLSMRLSEEAGAELSGDDPGDRLARAVNSLTLAACCQRTGDLSKAIPYYREMIDAGRKGGFSYATLSALGSLAEMEMLLSRLDRAAGLCTEAIEQSTRWGSGNPLPGAAFAHIVRGQLEYERNHLDAAEKDFQYGIRLGETGAHRESVLRGCLHMVRLRQTQGDAESASEYVHRAENLGPWVIEPDEVRRIPAWKAASALRRGDLDSAKEWARQREGSLPLSRPPECRMEFDFLTLARIRLAADECDGLPQHLEAFMRNAERQGRIGILIEALVLSALAHERLGESDEAEKTLDRAFSLGEPAGYIRTFADEGEPLAALAGRVTAGGVHAQLVARVLDAIGLPGMEKPARAGGQVIAHGLIEALSEREMEVLRLIEAGRSNKEIADVLFLAVGTVKKHTSNIFGKLGAESRTQAVAMSRKLGIL